MRIFGKDHPDDYADERPYLVYPLGPGDDPQDLLTFVGVKVRPACDDPDDSRHHRARVLIEFFHLDREGLEQSRAYVVLVVWLAIVTGDSDALDILTAPGAAHTSCARCFRTLCENDLPKAAHEAAVAREIYRRRTR
jgi:hypothetical protein